MRTKLLQTYIVSVVFGILGCSGTDNSTPPDDVGGGTGVNLVGGSGPTSTGGTSSVITAGNTSAPTGGSKATGGTAGSLVGGAATGGKSSTGGAAAGGSAAGGSSSINCSASPPSGGTQHCSSSTQGTIGSFGWSIWSSGSGGCITPYGVGAAFKATWNNSGDFLARVGFQWDETKTYDQYGTISADFTETKSGAAGGYSMVGIYGWSNNPLIEFYIVDDWFTGRPGTNGGTTMGTIDIDGGTYDIWTHQQVNQPSIHGTTTFMQYFSVRKTQRTCGHISITEHFKKWASLGMNLGKMYEAKILIEAGGGVGSIDFPAATMTAK